MAPEPRRRRALEGLTVVECNTTNAAAYATKLMADLGATVIKVEPPQGDPARALGPFPQHVADPDKSGTFLYLNTNKFSVSLDLTHSAGRALLDRVLTTADVFVSDLSPREAEVGRLTWPILRDLNDHLIMVSIFPFGARGPKRDYRAYDLTILSAGGWTWLNGWADHEEMPPLKPYGMQSAYQAGTTAAVAAMGALVARSRGLARGQHVEVSAQECIASILETALPSWNYANRIVARHSRRRVQPMDMFECKDGSWIYVLAIEEHQWLRLVDLMGGPEWAGLEVFATRFDRGANWDTLRPVLAEWVAQWEGEELYRAAQANRIPFAPASTLADLVKSEHLRMRGFFVEVDHPAVRRLPHAGAPYKLGLTPWEIRSPAPTLGQHNHGVFAGRLGLEVTEEH